VEQTAKTVLVSLVALLGSASVLVWIRIVIRRWQGLTLVPFEPRRPVPWGAVSLVLCTLATLTVHLGVLLAVGASPGAPAARMTSDQIARLALGSSAANLAVLVGGTMFLVLSVGASRHDLGLPGDRRTVWRDAALGLAAFAAATPVVYAMQAVLVRWFPSEHPIKIMLDEQLDLMSIAVSLFAAVIAAPLFEEFFFRLLVQGWFERLESWRAEARSEAVTGLPPGNPRASVRRPDADPVGPADGAFVAGGPGRAGTSGDGGPPPLPPGRLPRGALPIAGSSFLFAAMHAGYGPDPIPLFVLATVLGYLYQRTHRIVPCITVHALFNAFSMTIYFLDRAAGNAVAG